MDINEMKKTYTDSAQQLNALNAAIAYLHQNIGPLEIDAAALQLAGRSALATRQQLARDSLHRLQQDRNNLIASRKMVEELIRHYAAEVSAAASTSR